MNEPKCSFGVLLFLSVVPLAECDRTSVPCIEGAEGSQSDKEPACSQGFMVKYYCNFKVKFCSIFLGNFVLKICGGFFSISE